MRKETIMADLKTLSVQKREALGKGPNRRLRAQQVIPCVFYDAGGDNFAVQAPAKELFKLYDEVGRTTVFNIEYDENGKKVVRPALFWSIQFHPVKRAFTHIDFYGVDLDKEVKLAVPLEFVGTAKGTKLGGKLETYREQIFVKGKPLSIPARLCVDVSDLGVNDVLHIADLKLPEGLTAAMAANFAVVSVISREEAEAAEAEGGVEAAPAAPAA
jgi:large subunit ribosomal protein L25